MKTYAGLVTLFVAATLTFAVTAGEKSTKVTYRWVDDNNIVQFTERPPKDRAYERIVVTSSGGREIEEVSADQAASNASDDETTPLDEIAKANERNCAVAKQNLEVLQNIARIRVTENGEERILSPEEKQARIQETQKQIDVFCKPAPAAS